MNSTDPLIQILSPHAMINCKNILSELLYKNKLIDVKYISTIDFLTKEKIENFNFKISCEESNKLDCLKIFNPDEFYQKSDCDKEEMGIV